MMADFPQDSVRIGQFVTLEPLVPQRDAAPLFAISHDSADALRIFTYLQRGPYENVAQMQEFLEAWCADPAVVAFIVKDKPTGALAGTLSLMNIRAEHGVAEIGYVWYSPKFQRTKTNTESVYLLLAYLFDELGYRRAEWKCDVRNQASGRTALRLGFTFEGVFRKHMIIRNANRDSAWYSIIDDEWPARRDVLTHWLYVDDSVPLSNIHRNELPY
jgi:RimJ/RimL family protein N-acetyltransferase